MLAAERDGFQAVLLGPPEGTNWQTQDDRQMCDVFDVLGIRRGVVPKTVPEFSGRIAEEGEPYVTNALDDGRSLVRFSNPCEGGWLCEAEQALTLTLGGCMLIAASGTDQGGARHLAACHAGFHSLVDVGMLEGNPPRRFESVIDSITSAFEHRYHIPTGEIDIECFFGLAPGALIYHYNYPGRGELHKKYMEYLVPRWGPEAAQDIETEQGKAVVVDPGAIFLAQTQSFKSTARSCDITTNGPFASTRHKDKAIAHARSNFSTIIRTR